MDSAPAQSGTTTGVSAADRARTILTAIAVDAGPRDLARPGHVFPLRSRTGGVLVRAGHTEAAVDLARIAGLTAAHSLLLETILRQQIADIHAGRPPGSRVDPAGLTGMQRSRLKAALKHVALLPEMVQDVLTSAASSPGN